VASDTGRPDQPIIGLMTEIRLADPATDAAAIAEIYRPSVTDSFVSFEETPPTAAEMAARIEATLTRTPWLVATEGGDVIGYAYAGQHRERAGYRWSVDVSAYVRADRHGRGIGSALYRSLIRILTAQGFVNVYAGITQPNAASVALHRSIGMELVGVYRGVGYKLGAWRDVAWYQLRLTDDPGDPDPPAEPIPIGDLQAAHPSLLADV
jgi:L-amino acid N-acyltransferase YncA